MDITVLETCHLHTESVSHAAASSETLITVNKNTVNFINIIVSNFFLRRNVEILKNLQHDWRAEDMYSNSELYS